MYSNEGQTSVIADEAAAHCVAERKPWHKPELVSLSVRETRGGVIQTTFEGPFNFLFGLAS